jgi:hypothetical protein
MNEREQVRSVASRWKSQYPQDVEVLGDERSDDIFAKLEQLNLETATAQDVAAIIGNPSWVCPQRCNECEKRSFEAFALLALFHSLASQRCNECEKRSFDCVRLGEECLRTALGLIEENRKCVE